MDYMISEGKITLPSQDFKDLSIHVFQFNDLDTSLVIARGVLKPGETLPSSFNQQMKKLEKGMKNFLMKDRKQITFGSQQQYQGIECYSQYETPANLVCQYQLAVQYNDLMLAFSYTKNTLLPQVSNDIAAHQPTKEHWEFIKAHIVLNELSK